MQSNQNNIQWFPGHMAKTRRLITEGISKVDIVVEIVDARVPSSSRNPIIEEIIGEKPHLILLNKKDMAEEAVTTKWLNYYKSKGIPCLPINCKDNNGTKQVIPTVENILKDKIERWKAKGMQKSIKMMVVGVPNCGKSSFINRLIGFNKAKVENRAGVTRQNQWFSVSKNVELLDTPGVLWPKFEDESVGIKLAITGAIKENIVDIETLGANFVHLVSEIKPEILMERYKLTDLTHENGYDLLEKIACKRGMKLSKDEYDIERAAKMVIDEYKNSKLGKITLELPPDTQK